jgi:SNF2 family DNA or RNA helicase
MEVKLNEPYTLLPHQVKTLEWMKKRENLPSDQTWGVRGGMVSLQMGLGKTLIALYHTMSSPKSPDKFPTLIVASKTVLTEWKSQGVEKFFAGETFGEEPSATPIKALFIHKDYIGETRMKSLTRANILKYDIVLTTYDVCLSACRKGKHQKSCLELGEDNTLMKGKIVAIHEKTRGIADNPKLTGIEVIYGTPWHRVFCDESQRFCNPNTILYKCMMAIYGRYKWCITGTPIRNYDTDIWTQLRWMGYNGCKTATGWCRNGEKLFVSHKLDEVIFSMNYEQAEIVLPEKTVHSQPTPFLTKEEKDIYQFVLDKTMESYSKMMAGEVSFACVLAWFIRLRQASIAPYLLVKESKRGNEKKKDEEDDHKAFETDAIYKFCHDKQSTAGIQSTRMKLIMKILKSIPPNEKVIIFSMFTSAIDLLSDALDEFMPDYPYVQMDGDTDNSERITILKNFREGKKDVRAMLMTYKVGSEGINLTEATHCILMEPWWCPAVHSQAVARIHRSGQKEPVHVYQLITQGTIELKVLEICDNKIEMASKYLDPSEMKELPNGKGLNKFMMGEILGFN